MKKIKAIGGEPTKKGAILNAIAAFFMAVMGIVVGIPEVGLTIALIWTVIFAAYGVYQILIFIGLTKKGE